MEEALVDALRGVGALGSLVGNRIRWNEAEEGLKLPYLLLIEIPGTPIGQTLAGPDALTQRLVQANCRGASYLEAVAVRAAFIAACDALKAAPLQVFPERMSGGEISRPGAKTIHQASADVRVWHTDA